MFHKKRPNLMKKSLIVKIIIICLFLTGCSASESDSPLYINILKTLERDPFYELGTAQVDKWGFEGVFAHELVEKMSYEEFFFYLYDSSVSDTLMEEMLSWGFAEENIDVLAKGYVIDFSILNDVEKERVREIFPENTLYAIQNGTVISAFSEYPLIPKEQNSDYDEKYKMAIESWIYSTMVGVNNHGFETITYEEVQRKIENEEIFMLYVGRNSCKFCQVFVPVLKNVMNSYDFYTYCVEGNEYVPLYYLDTQSYYNDIWDEKVKLKEHSIVNLDVSNNLGSHFIEITSGSRNGNSGSGVFNEKGECVGILVGSNPSSVYILPSSIFLKECEKILGRPLYQD